MNRNFFASTVLVEAINKCNLACDFCEANCTANQHLPRREISPEALAVMLEKLERLIVNVVFQGDCEPTLNRRLPELVEVAARFTSSVALVTNGTQLREAYVRELIARGVSWFALSIDDHRPEVFNRLRPPADLDVLLGHLARLTAIRDNESPHVHVVVHKIVFPNDDLDSLKAFVRRFYLEHGVNQITFAPLVEQGTIKCPDWLTLRNRLEVELLDEGIYINLREFGAYPYKTTHRYCGTNLLFIDHQGELSPCGLHVRRHRGFGNLLTQSLEEIGASERFVEFHRYWQNRRYAEPLPSYCQDCFVLKGHYHRYTLNEGHQRGLQFLHHPDLHRAEPPRPEGTVIPASSLARRPRESYHG
jgi:radical SAM protein with 4Fe4S-binding SPASM domain